MRTHTHGTHGRTTRVYSLKRSAFFRFPHTITFLINTRSYLLRGRAIVYERPPFLADMLTRFAFLLLLFLLHYLFCPVWPDVPATLSRTNSKNSRFPINITRIRSSLSKHKPFQRTRSGSNLTQLVGVVRFNFTWT